jgi:NADP-dependent aldehyde dehydrogenase
MKYTAATWEQIDAVMVSASEAFQVYKKVSAENRALFLEAIATEIENLGDALIIKASEETNIPPKRLMGERARTTMQLRSFAGMLREGSWVEASIDTAQPERTPLPKVDIRKMLVPIGPIVVFGASNFPFAYSTAGGDTASALAAGNPVIVKAHPGHAETSELVYQAIQKAIALCVMPSGVFQHVHGEHETGKALLQHPVTAGVGFTGSYTGGNALLKYASERVNPIPVFCEMGSVNPVILLPDTVEKNGDRLAAALAESVTLGMGQFCTNPGLLMGLESEALRRFQKTLTGFVQQVTPAKMLSSNIHKSFVERKEKAVSQQGVDFEETKMQASALEPLPNIASVKGSDFLQNHVLKEEVFGPFSLLVRCRDVDELKAAWRAVSGQLTTSLFGTEEDFAAYADLLELAETVAGRIVFNSVPTGVEVCPSMVHGGPYPSTTDSRFTAVGINAVKRWVRPVCFQNCPENLLPEELRNRNGRNIWRFVNNEWTRNDV